MPEFRVNSIVDLENVHTVAAGEMIVAFEAFIDQATPK
jgi:hypothetical protein